MPGKTFQETIPSGRETGEGAGNQDIAGRHGPRCIALTGPFGSGKTTLLEAILARTGAIPRQGTVAAGNMTGDASAEARAHGMSVEANFAETTYLGDRFSFIDCPGSIEFLAEMEGVLPGVDMAIVVAEDDERKLPALQLILKALEAQNIPRMLFLNKIDREARGVRAVLDTLQPASAVPLVLRQLPIWEDGRAVGFIDLALERAHVYHEKEESTRIDMSDHDRVRELEARYTMLETLADHDDDLMEALLEDIAPDPGQVFGDLVREMQDGLICPVFFGSAEHGNGVGRLLKALRHEAPSVAHTRKRAGLGDEPRVQEVLKTLHTPHGGKLSITRVLSGTVADGDVLTDPRGAENRVSGVFSLLGQQVSKRGPAQEGELVGLGRLDNLMTGDCLSGKAQPSSGARSYPYPVLALSVRAGRRQDDVRLSAALAKLTEEDPSLIVRQSQDSGEMILEGQGEMHLRVAQEKLTGKFGLVIETGSPAIPYAETIRGSTQVRARHKKQSGGHGQFGDVALEISSQDRGEGVAFSDRITGGVVPKQYIASVREGVLEALQKGPLGFQVVDVAVCLTDGSYHSVDSSDQAFRMAAIQAMREGLEACKPVLLEPVLKVTIQCPTDVTARVNAIVSARRGQLLGFDARQGWEGWDEVQALIPQAETFDLIIELRSASAGVASYSASFDHMAEVNGKAADQVLSRTGGQAAA
ncbi:elongation factor G [Roseibium litorale]|uniref:Elongation factor G n=1 Tax=Roseibium litorale TaxID=2803841 RepID=A0ABR9CG96_9HYPH|nr:elongation factor G [Roseibium litorale]MBD8889939.1 elongation factor G [Roseibium litorale]